jgi:hypothetical protein
MQFAASRRGTEMGMPRGLIKATAYYNKIEAWKDWKRVAQQAIDAGASDLVDKYQPEADAGWRTIDKCRHKLEAELAGRR